MQHDRTSQKQEFKSERLLFFFLSLSLTRLPEPLFPAYVRSFLNKKQYALVSNVYTRTLGSNHVHLLRPFTFIIFFIINGFLFVFTRPI